MSSEQIYLRLKVFIPTERAIYQPAIRPSFSRERRQVTSFLQVAMSPASNAHSSEAKKAYSPIFYVGCRSY